MSSTLFILNHTSPIDVGGTASPTRTRKTLLRRFVNFLFAAIGGTKKVTSFDIFPDGETPSAASGTVTLSTSSGTVGATINGVSITTAFATSDTATAAALAAAINASTNALVQYLVTATSAAGVVTITSTQKNRLANAITLAASGIGATASGARLTGGAGGNVAVQSVTL